MSEEKRAEIRNWLIKAQHDLGSARRLMEGKPPWSRIGAETARSNGTRMNTEKAGWTRINKERKKSVRIPPFAVLICVLFRKMGHG